MIKYTHTGKIASANRFGILRDIFQCFSIIPLKRVPYLDEYAYAPDVPIHIEFPNGRNRTASKYVTH